MKKPPLVAAMDFERVTGPLHQDRRMKASGACKTTTAPLPFRHGQNKAAF
jgi:hypothetical protein